MPFFLGLTTAGETTAAAVAAGATGVTGVTGVTGAKGAKGAVGVVGVVGATWVPVPIALGGCELATDMGIMPPPLLLLRARP